MNPYSATGDVIQAAVVDSANRMQGQQLSQSLKLGIIEDYYTVDNTDTTISPQGAYTMYCVRLFPYGQPLYNVMPLMPGGHINSNVNIPGYGANNSSHTVPLASVQNVEETPYVVGQLVLVGFINGSTMNPIILGSVPCIQAASGQTTAKYPKKYGSFQGTNWSIDNTGNVELDVNSASSIKVTCGGSTLFVVKNGELDLGGDSSDTSMQPALLGTNLVTWLNNHTHIVAGITTGLAATATGPADSSAYGPVPSDAQSSVVKVL